ncbi:MAG: cytochrome b [Alphaproteobacteria bacterium]|nr:cytochrome b [Alphaproteobacteria bacterium]
MWRDTAQGYGIVSRVLHWLLAIVIVVLFALGWWMVGLDYTSAYYNLAPAWHEAIGILVLLAMTLRVGWRIANTKPDSDHLTLFEQRASVLMHWALYAVIFAVLISGYLISTADGRAIEIFGPLRVPSLIYAPGIESLSGKIHRILSYVTIGLAGLHTGAALKHHFVDRDPTLSRMWRGAKHH